MSLFSPSITSSSDASNFTINSFTQNLASVLSDTHRTKSEIAAFFTRHWGEQFVPRLQIAPAPTIPAISLEHFRHYLATTGRKHRQYLRARKALRRGAIKQKQKEKDRGNEATTTNISRDEIADIFFANSFQNRDPSIFESIFLEPKAGEPDKLLSNAERRRMHLATAIQDNQISTMGRHESVGSLSSIQSVQQPSQPVEACAGRMFRACQRLQQRLEFFDDTISALLNQQLETKNEQFWRTINAYGILEADLGETIARIKEIRHKMVKSKVDLVDRSKRILQLHYAKLNRQKLMARLHEIACLRDAQSTVQMLLNQENIPSALECIHTAQEVLGSELRGANCFRHLGSQLEEMTRIIGKMLLEEFEAGVQREFAWPFVEDGSARGKTEEQQREEHHLQAIVASLIRCGEFRFVTILREEISAIVKNTKKQIVKSQLLDCLESAATLGFNPSTLSEQIVQLTDEQWAQTLRAVIHSLAIFCIKILTIQKLVIKCAEMGIAQQKEGKCLKQKSIASRSPSICSERSIPLPTNGHHNRRPSIYSAASEPLKIQQTGGIDSFSIGGAANSRNVRSECAWPTKMPGNNEEEEEDEEDDDLDQGQPQMPTIEERAAFKFGQAKSPSPNQPSNIGVSLLSMPCRDCQQLRTMAPQLIVLAVHNCEERVAKLVQARFKDTVLSICSPRAFNETCQIVDEFVAQNRRMMNSPELGGGNQRSPAQAMMQQMTSKFLTKFTESRRGQLSLAIDSELWKPLAKVPSNVQKLVDKFASEGQITDEEGNGEEEGTNDAQGNIILMGDEPPYMVVGSACLLLRLIGQFADLLRLFPGSSMALALDIVQCLKLFNSRTCQLILGAGARQLVGLKTISVRHLALASRSIQLIGRFIPSIRQLFADQLPLDRQNLLRHFDSTARDYADHVAEIRAKLLTMMDKELIGALEEWKLEGNVPTPAFQQIVMQIGKFYSSYSAVMPPELTTEMLHAIHANFRLYFKQHCQSRAISPHDSLTYGMAGQDFAYYLENVRAFPDCQTFPDDSIAEVLQQKRQK